MAFDEVADGYEARPPYPPELYELLVADRGVGSGCAVLEVGRGRAS